MVIVPFTTDRLLIRRFEAGDLSPFLRFILDRESTAYLMFDPEQRTEPGATALFNYVCSSYDSDQPVHSYAIADKVINRYLGSCGYAPYGDGIVECYYSVNTGDAKQGIATEAIEALAAALAETVEIRAYCHPKNYAAHRVAVKSGFVPKGSQVHLHFGITGELFVYHRSG